MPAPSPGVVDCLWSATPQSFRQSLDPAVDADHFDHLLDAWTPRDEQLAALADRCHLASASADQPAYQLAALAIISKARSTWAKGRLATVYKVTPGRLEDSWRQLSPDDRSLLGHFMMSLDPNLMDKAHASLVTFVGTLQAADPDEVAAATAYLYGRALTETLDTGSGK